LSRLCWAYGGYDLGVEEATLKTLVYKHTWVEAWINTLVAWLGVLTELFYAGHLIAIFVILAITSAPPSSHQQPQNIPPCYNILVRVAAFLVVHHVIALIRCGVRLRRRAHHRDVIIAAATAGADDNVSDNAIDGCMDESKSDDLHKCFVVIRVCTFIMCGAGVLGASTCVSTPLGLCILAHLAAMVASLFLLLGLCLLQRFCTPDDDHNPQTTYNAC
jgi:hypothetical protein